MARDKLLGRRGFLKKTLASAAAVAARQIVPACALGRSARAATAPSERVTLGCIGVGGMGTGNTEMLLNAGAQILAVCDVKSWEREKAQNIVNEKLGRGVCSTYSDFRQLLARDDIDAVMIATPDQWHVPIAVTAAKAGKDVYLEKPLGISIDEGKIMRETVKKTGVVFMHGTEMRANQQRRFACELVRNGRIGKVHTINVNCPQGQVTGEHEEMPIPDGFDYDFWLGPAPYKPYTYDRCEDGWYYIADYQPSGFIAGWGVHPMDLVHWAMDLEDSGPVEIEATGKFPAGGLYDTPYEWNIHYTYADGTNVNFINNDKDNDEMRISFLGTEGTIDITYVRGIDATPKELLTSTIKPQEVHLKNVKDDNADFLHCVRTREQPISPIEAAHRATSVCYLGYIALVTSRKLTWDPEAEIFPGDEEANRMLTRPIRSPWHTYV